MKAFQCTCRQPLFFDNTQCLGCKSEVAFDPGSLALGPVKQTKPGEWSFARERSRKRPAFRFCANRATAAACNWLVPVGSPHPLCTSCRLTRTIPILDRPKNADRWRDCESAKRRVLYLLLFLQLPIVPKEEDPEHGLVIDFLESLPDETPVMTGHASGVITINVAEADPDYREFHRENLQEPYRTLVGHLRHELAHYYWDLLIPDTPWLEKFRALFGDERADYGEALKKHYKEGAPADWRSKHISAYAASHPWEDWAETWAHYFHLRATLQSAADFGLGTARTRIKIDPFGLDALYRNRSGADDEAFIAWINAWVVLTTVLNEVSRSMGQPDLYPFVLNKPTVTKLHFVHCVIGGERGMEAPPPPELAAPEAPEVTKSASSPDAEQRRVVS